MGRSGYMFKGEKACSDCACGPPPAGASASSSAPGQPAVATPGEGINAFFGVKSAPDAK